MVNTPPVTGWTGKSLLQASAASIGTFLVILQLGTAGAWPDFEWLNLILPAAAGALALVSLHRNTWLLSLVLFLPLMTLALWFLAVVLAVAGGNDL